MRHMCVLVHMCMCAVHTVQASVGRVTGDCTSHVCTHTHALCIACRCALLCLCVLGPLAIQCSCAVCSLCFHLKSTCLSSTIKE